MNAERFETLVAAYGADSRRWPEAERAAALAWQEDNRALAERLLFDARMLDAALELAPAASESADLRARVLAGAPKPRPERSAPRLPLRWLQGAGLLAAGVAGVIVGAAYAADVSADLNAEAALAYALPAYDAEDLT